MPWWQRPNYHGLLHSTVIKIIFSQTEIFNVFILWLCPFQRRYNVGGWWMNEYRALVKWHWQGKHWSSHRKLCTCVTVFATVLTSTGLRLNPVFGGKMPATNCLIHEAGVSTVKKRTSLCIILIFMKEWRFSYQKLPTTFLYHNDKCYFSLIINFSFERIC